MYRCVFLVAVAIAACRAYGPSCSSGSQCITLESCSVLHDRLEQTGSNPALMTLLRRLHCGFEYDKPMVCCPPEFTSPSPQSSRVGDVHAQGSGGVHGQGSGGVHGQGSDGVHGQGTGEDHTQGSSVNPTSLLPSNKVCGIQSNDRIVGGTRADLDEHPWMALLRYDKAQGWGFYCGGVLISSRYVMTAAHCVKGQDLPPTWRLSQVRLGEWNTSSARDCYDGDCSSAPQDVAVEEIIAHEEYDPEDTNQHNDIALLRLARDVQYTDFVKPICLPTTNSLRNEMFEGYDMEVAGWGKTESRSESDVKLKVRVPVVATSECSQVFQRVGRRIIGKQLCAGGAAGRDSCRGDSGGALMGRTPAVDNWIAVGVVSYGPSPCGTPGWPGVYTRVGAYVDWIISKLKP